MSTKELLIKEIENLAPSDVWRVQHYIRQLKAIKHKAIRPYMAQAQVNIDSCRKFYLN